MAKEKKCNMIVLGAGASIGSKRTTINNFFQEKNILMPSSDNYFHETSLVYEENDDNFRYLNMLAFTHTNVYELISRLYNFKNKEAESGFIAELYKGINLESVFTLFDIGTQMLDKNSEWYQVHENAKESLTDYFTSDLILRSEGQECEYFKKILEKLNPTDNIISFNWDTICDNTLKKSSHPIYKNYISLFNEKNINIKDYTEKGNYLKLHGSLNWRICKNRKCKNYKKIILGYGEFQGTHKCLTIGCPICMKDTEALVIPPTSNKLLSKNHFIHKLWMIARELILKTDRFIFIGYSFPPNDFITEWLFRHIYLTERYEKNNYIPEVIIVNPDIEKSDSDVSKRYNSLFSNVEIKKFTTLEEFCKQGLELID